MQKETRFEEIIAAFRQSGCRVTEQRKNLIKLIINNPTCTCKELYYLVNEANKGIGRATVYRTIKSLEEMGFISRRTISFI